MRFFQKTFTLRAVLSASRAVMITAFTHQKFLLKKRLPSQSANINIFSIWHRHFYEAKLSYLINKISHKNAAKCIMLTL